MLVGLTGGIGCGKSTVIEFLKKEGIPCLQTDLIVRQLLTENEQCIQAVCDAFGSSILTDKNIIDRPRVAQIVFNDPAALKKLEQILHPAVRKAWKEAYQTLAPSAFVVEIPLLFEKNLEKEFNLTLCISVSEKIQLQRLRKRGVIEEDAKRRITHQLPLTEKRKRADYVLSNNGSLAFLASQVNLFVNKYLRS